MKMTLSIKDIDSKIESVDTIGKDSEKVEFLMGLVQELRQELLERELDSEEPELEDGDIMRFRQNFRDYLAGQRPADMISFYTKSRLADMKPAMRKQVVAELIRFVDNSDLSVPQCWTNINNLPGYSIEVKNV
jgi:hypothetical protein